MSLAFHDPQKIEEAVKAPSELKDQAAALGLETDQWWEE